MRVSIQMAREAGVSPVGLKRYFEQQGWPWLPFLNSGGRDLTEEEVDAIPEPYRTKLIELSNRE